MFVAVTWLIGRLSCADVRSRKVMVFVEEGPSCQRCFKSIMHKTEVYASLIKKRAEKGTVQCDEYIRLERMGEKSRQVSRTSRVFHIRINIAVWHSTPSSIEGFHRIQGTSCTNGFVQHSSLTPRTIWLA